MRKKLKRLGYVKLRNLKNTSKKPSKKSNNYEQTCEHAVSQPGSAKTVDNCLVKNKKTKLISRSNLNLKLKTSLTYRNKINRQLSRNKCYRLNPKSEIKHRNRAKNCSIPSDKLQTKNNCSKIVSSDIVPRGIRKVRPNTRLRQKPESYFNNKTARKPNDRLKVVSPTLVEYCPLHKTIVTCSVIGGLGNQLFQIFGALAYGFRHNCTIRFPNVHRKGPRPTYWHNFLQKLKPWVGGIDENGSLRVVRQGKYSRYVAVPKPRHPHDNIKIDGYRQHPKYFSDYLERIITYVGIRQLQIDLSQEFDFSQSITLHFRLGDYHGDGEHHGLQNVLPLKFYIKSLELLGQSITLKDYTVYYCYELKDSKRIDQRISILSEKFPGVCFKPIPPELPDWKQMLFISLCNHNIIANSTFSWWGACFNRSPGKKVYIPNPWFRRGDSSDSFTLEGWECVGY